MFRSAVSCALGLAIVGHFVVGPAVAQQENCLPALQPDIVDLTRSVETNLVILDRMLSTSNEADATKIGAKYEQYSFDYGRSKNAANMIKKMLNIDYTNKERDTVYLSTLSDNALEAYKACVGSRSEIGFTFVGSVIDTDPIFLSIDWTPRDRPTSAKSDLFVKLTQGTIEESGTREFRGEIQDRKSAFVTIKRDPFQRTQILIRVNDKNLQVQIPARSRMKLVKNILSSMDPPGVSYGTGTVETSGNIGGPVCVRIPNDAQDKFIIPESFKIISYKDQRSRVTRNDRITVSNEREVCAQIDVVFDTVFKSYAYMDIRGTAEVMMAVPNN